MKPIWGVLKVNNREKLATKLKEENLTIGCYQQQIEHLSEDDLNKVLEQMLHGSCDVQVTLNNQPFVVEVYHVDKEVDFELISESDYEMQYGRTVNN